MYNIDFLPQIEASRRRIFGLRGDYTNLMAISDTAYARYHSSKMRLIECHEDINGEWVPNTAIRKNTSLQEENLSEKP